MMAQSGARANVSRCSDPKEGPMRFATMLALMLMLGCGPQANTENAPNPGAPSTVPPPASPVQTVQLDVDASDYIDWGEGGGIDGRWKGTRLSGDGRVELSEGPTPHAEQRIDPAQAARILQAAVDAGLLELKDHPASGADMLGKGISAQLDGHRVRVSKDEMTPDPAWDRVWDVLRLP